MRSIADIVMPNSARVKRHCVPHLPTQVWPTTGVKRSSSVGHVLATNLRAIIDAAQVSPSALARTHRIPPRNVHNILTGQHSPSIELVEAVADAAHLMAWQILVPGLDPRNPPVVTLTKEQRDLMRRLRVDASDLPPL